MYSFGNITIYYFSGTGNALTIAKWMSEFAHRSKVPCQVDNISKIDFCALEPVHPETLIVLIAPIHGFNYPKIVLRFIRHFPKGKNCIVLMNTRAGMRIGRFVTPGLTGIAFLLSSVILKMKGYKIKGQIPFDMPSNWISIHPALRNKSIQFIHKKNYERLEKHCNRIFSGKSDFQSIRDLAQDILIAPVSLLYYLAGRFIFAKSYYASSACDNCGLCINNCPVKAIKLKHDRPYWTFHCESCMKCMNYCPKKAIETAHGLFAVICLAGSAMTSFIMHKIQAINLQDWHLHLFLFTFIFFLLLWLLYRVQHLLLRSRIIAKAIALTSFTHYSFWGRYTSISDDKWKKPTQGL